MDAIFQFPFSVVEKCSVLQSGEMTEFSADCQSLTDGGLAGGYQTCKLKISRGVNDEITMLFASENTAKALEDMGQVLATQLNIGLVVMKVTSTDIDCQGDNIQSDEYQEENIQADTIGSDTIEQDAGRLDAAHALESLASGSEQVELISTCTTDNEEHYHQPQENMELNSEQNQAVYDTETELNPEETTTTFYIQEMAAEDGQVEDDQATNDVNVIQSDVAETMSDTDIPDATIAGGGSAVVEPAYTVSSIADFFQRNPDEEYSEETKPTRVYKRKPRNIHAETVCKLCSVQFADKNELMDHVKGTHITPGRSETITKAKRYLRELLRIQEGVCPECGLTFSRLDTLNNHMRRFHTARNQVKIMCPICKNIYKSKLHFKDHMRAHANKGLEFDMLEIFQKQNISLTKKEEGYWRKLQQKKGMHTMTAKKSTDVDVSEPVAETDGRNDLVQNTDLQPSNVDKSLSPVRTSLRLQQKGTKRRISEESSEHISNEKRRKYDIEDPVVESITSIKNISKIEPSDKNKVMVSKVSPAENDKDLQTNKNKIEQCSDNKRSQDEGELGEHERYNEHSVTLTLKNADMVTESSGSMDGSEDKPNVSTGEIKFQIKIENTQPGKSTDVNDVTEADSTTNWDSVELLDLSGDIPDIVFSKYRRVRCPICHRTAKNAESMMGHFNYKHKNHPMKPTYCQKLLKCMRCQCEHCGKILGNPSVLRRHIKETHSTHEAVCCTMCNKTFAGAHLLQAHMKRVHENTTVESCNLCGKRFKSKNSLKFHIQYQHDETNRERKFLCNICGKSFFKEVYLKVHHQTHTGQKPFVCTLCGKKFSRKRHLDTHQHFLHSDNKIFFKCQVCNKSFSRAQGLKNHYQAQHGDACNYVCTYCQRNFVGVNNLKEHIIAVHRKDQGFKCPECFVLFPRQRQLWNHLRKEHNKQPSIDYPRDEIEVQVITPMDMGEGEIIQEVVGPNNEVQHVVVQHVPEGYKEEEAHDNEIDTRPNLEDAELMLAIAGVETEKRFVRIMTDEGGNSVVFMTDNVEGGEESNDPEAVLPTSTGSVELGSGQTIAYSEASSGTQDTQEENVIIFTSEAGGPSSLPPFVYNEHGASEKDSALILTHPPVSDEHRSTLEVMPQSMAVLQDESGQLILEGPHIITNEGQVIQIIQEEATQ